MLIIKKGCSWVGQENWKGQLILINPERLISIALSRAYFLEASNEVQKPTDEQDAQKIQLNFAKAIDEARKASQNSPNWVATFENLGMVYRDIRGFAQGASDWAIDSFSKAANLEPTNPVFLN